MKILRRQRIALTYLMLFLTVGWQIGQPLRGVTVYWDINGTTAGASGTSQATGTWDGTNTFFNTDSTGGAAGTIAAWSAGDILAFAAGSNARNAYTVTVAGTQSIGGLVFEEGLLTLTGGTLQLAANSDINVASTLTATVQSVVDGAFNLTKTGAGTLVLGGTNTYSGNTIINSGILSISADANLGTAPGAVVADSLTFGGGTLQVTGTSNPVINSNRGMTINPGITGTVQVAAAANTVTYGGVITGAVGTTFSKTGAGTLDLQGNSAASMLGALNVSGGTLRLSGAGTLGGVSSVTLGNRAVLTLDNTATNLGDRLSGGAFTSNGGTLNFTHAGAAATSYAETIGAVALNSGGLNIVTSQAITGQTSVLTVPSLSRSAGGTAFFSGTGLGTDTRNSITLGTAPALVNNVLAYAVVSNGALTSFANYATSGGTNQALRPLALASHDQTTQGTGWIATDNLRPTADQALSGNRLGYTLTLDNGIDLSTSSTTDRLLTLGNGTFAGILQTGGVSEIRANSTGDLTVDFTTSEGIVHVIGTLNMIRSGANNFSGSGGITKTGPGLLTVQVNGNTGPLRLNEGIYRATGSSTSAIGPAAASIVFNGGNLELAHTASLSYVAAGPVLVNSDATITIDRTAAGAGITHTLPGPLTIGNQTLTVAKGSLINADSAYGLTFSNTAVGVTLTGSPTFLIDNNGTATGTINLASVNSSAGAHTIIKQGTGNLIMSGTGGFQNAINVEAGLVGWSNNTTATNITESNSIYGAGGLVKTGASTVNLTGQNTYQGPTTITAGVLQAQDGVGLSSGSNLVLNGAVFQSSGSFTRSLGAGAGQVQWAAGANGGFAANGGPLTVTLSGAPNPIQWDTPAFVSGAGALLFGSASADDVVTFANNIDLNHTGVDLSRTFTVNDNIAVTTDKVVLSGILSNSSGNGGLTKTGAGILQLTGANTFTGTLAVNVGTLQFETVSNNGGAASNLGQGTDGISLAGGTLMFTGSVSQSTDRAVAIPSGTSTLNASGTGGAIITFNGAFSGGGALNLDGTGEGILNGIITQSGTTSDLNKNGPGTWTLAGTNTIADNLVISGGMLIMAAPNIFGTGSGDDLFIRAATLKLAVNGALTGLMDDLNVSTETATGGILDINGTTGSSPADIIVGTATLSGNVIDSLGGGSISATTTFAFRNGIISAGLTGAIPLNKTTIGNVTISGPNAGFTGATNISEGGTLVVDYTTSNQEKLGDAALVSFLGTGGLTLNGSNSAATVETIGGLALTDGQAYVSVNAGTGQTATLNLGTITRAAAGGMVSFNKSANAFLNTTSTNTSGNILGGWATLNGTSFITVTAGSIGAAAAVVKNDVTTWATGDDVTDSTGYFGTTGNRSINSLIFSAAGTSTVNVTTGQRLTITSGGILVSGSVAGNTASITGGTLLSGTGGELMIHQNNAGADFVISSTLSSTTSLTKGGTGTLLLNGKNFYSGQTTIQDGILRVAGGDGIGDRSLVELRNVASAILDLNNGTETIGGLTGGGAVGGTVAIGTGTLTLNNSATNTFIGFITGSGTLVKNGGSAQELEGNSTSGFTGNVIINQGLLHLDSTSGSLGGATGFTLNGPTASLLSDQDQDADVDRIGNSATITLNNTGGGNGLRIRNDNDLGAVRLETVGGLTIGAGHNVVWAEQSNAAAGTTARFSITNLARANQATLLVRGENLGSASATALRGLVVFGTAPAGAIGGGTAAGTSTMSIIPYIVGDASAGSGLGNSFVIHDGTVGIRPLNFTNEYTFNEGGYNPLTGVTTQNVRFDTDPTGVLTGGSKTINSLVLDSSTPATMTISGGAADNLTLASGALLATTTDGTHGTTINGFAGLLTGTSEYIIYTTNATHTLTIGSPLATVAASLTKSGAGTLVLNTANAFANGLWLNQGVVEAPALANLGTGALNFFGGTLRWGGVSNYDISTRTVALGVGGGTLDTGANDVTLANAIGNGGVGGLTKAGAGNLTLNAAASHTGGTTISAGTVTYGVVNALPTNSSLTLAGGALDVASHTTQLGSLTMTGNGTITGSAPVSFTGDVTNSGGNRVLTINNSATTTLGGGFVFLSELATARTLTIAGSGNVNVPAVVTDGPAAASTLSYAGTGTLTLSGINTYTGVTNIDSGTVVMSTDQNMVGGLRFGSANTVTTTGTLDLSNANASFGGTFVVQTNSTSANNLIIGATKTLTIGGNVAIGSAATALTDTVLNTSGGGSMVVNNPASSSSFIVGASTSGTAGSIVVADFSGLSNLTIALNTTNGLVRVNPVSSTNVSDRVSTLILPGAGAATTTITAATLAVGDSSQNNDTVAPFTQINQLKLGSGVNTLNINTVNIGTGGRDAGSITFNGASGSLILNDTTGSGPVTFNMGSGSANTGSGAANVFDVSGHNAVLNLGAVNIGTQTARVGAMTNVFSFDQGTLNMASLNLSSRNTANGTTSTFNIGGGIVNSGAITMATTGAAAGVAVANLNITGGTVTMSGNIFKGGGLGTDTANFLLTGASTILDMGAHSLGGAGANMLDNVVIESGTLKNLAEFNGGAAPLVKTTSGTLTMDGTNAYTSGTDIQEGTVIAVGGANNRLGTGGLSLGSGALSGVLQLGNAAGASNQTVPTLSTVGTGTANAIVGGNAAFSTLTVNQSANTTFNGALGGAGANQNNLNLVKAGAGELVVGAATLAGTVSVNGGKLFFDGFAGAATTLTSLTLGDGTEFSLRGTSPSTHSIYNFSGSGNVITVGSGVGGTLGFALDGGFNTRLNLGAGQTMTVNGTLTTAVYVNGAPNAGQPYVLINAVDDNAIFGSGTFNFNPVVFNGGSFTYALTQITAGAGEQWVLTPTAQAAAADVWWKGDLTGIAAGVWSASLTSGTGFPTNWDTTQAGGVDALVPPDSGSIVHFSANGASNFATTLGANLTIQELIFHSGGTAISIGSSGGTNTLTLGNTVDASGLTMLAGAPNVSISANVALAQAQSWNITDSTSTLTLSGLLGGVGPLSINNNGSSTGTLILSGVSGLATHSGGTNLVTGKMILEGGADDRLPVAGALTMGNATLGSTLQLGDAVNGASNTTIGTLSSGAALTNSIVGGGAAASALTITQGANGTFNGVIGGAGTNENNLALVKGGSATLTLNGVNTYNSTTTVNQGVLQLGSTGSITQSASLLVNANAGALAAFDVSGRTAAFTGGITLGGADSLATPQILDTATGGVLFPTGNIVYDATNNPLGGSIAAGVNFGAFARTILVGDSTAAATDLTISGNITNNSTGGANGFALSVDGAGTTLISGNVLLGLGSTDGANSDFNKNGTGTLNLTGTVTLSDNFTVNAGVVNINTGGSVIFNSAGGSSSPDFVMDSAGASVVNLNTAGALVGNNITNILYVRDGGTLNINAAGALVDFEEIRLGDDNQGIGNVVVNQNISVGILTVGLNSAGEVGNVTGTGTISGLNTINLDNGLVSANLSGVGNIDKDSLTVTLSGNNSLTGTTLVREGTLNLDFATNNLADSKIGTGNLTMGSTTNNDNTAVLALLGNSSAASLQTVANLIVAGGPSQINLTSNGGQDVTLRITGTLSRTGGSLNLGLPNANTKIEYAGSSVNSNGIVGGWLTMNDRDFVSIAGGQLVAATYTTQNDAGLWSTNANITNSGSGFNGTVTANCNTINSLRFDAADTSAISVTGSLILTSGAIMATSSVGANASTISGGSLVSGSGTFFFHQNNTSGTMTIASNLVGGAAITKNGAGMLVLTGTNVTGTVSIDEGILRLSGGNAVSDTSAVNIRGVAGTGLEILAGAANSETIGSLAGDGTLGQLIIGAGATLTVNQAATATFSGAISGSGTFIKSGGSTLTINGTSTMTGTVRVDQGQITMSGGSAQFATATAIILNGTGSILDTQDQTSTTSINRINNNATLTLNNTILGNGFQLTDSEATADNAEAIGALTLGSGHNVITATSSVAANVGSLTMASLAARNDRSTLLVRGASLGDSAATQRGQVIFTAAPGGANAAVGGNGASTTNFAIFPWMVGDTSATGVGNSFVRNTGTTNGLKPLTASEYVNNSATLASVAADSNVRYTATAGTTTPTAINSLVLDSGTAITLTGAASSMEITAGAILAAGAGNHIISGFSAITTGGSRDYNVFVTTATSTLTMNPALTSAVPLVKSGAGNLTLTNAGNAFTDLYLNQGLVIANDLDKLGTGTLRFHGGGLRLEAGFTDDLSTKAMNIGTGGGTLDVSLVTAGVILTNGLDATVSGAGGPLNIVTRSVATGNTGLLTIQGSSSYTGTTIINHALNSATVTSVLLNGDTNAVINGNLQIGNATAGTLDVVVGLGADEQIVDTAVLSFVSASGAEAYFKLFGRTETVAGISAASRGVIENFESATDQLAASGKLIVNTSEDFSYLGFLRDRSSGTGGNLAFEKQGTGVQILSGANIIYTGLTTISGGTLRLTDTTAFNSDILNNATLDLNRTTSTWTLAKAISGTGMVNKIGAGAVTLSGTNSYSGQTNIEQGLLSISATANLGDGSVTNSVRIANNSTLQSTGANVDLGASRSIILAGTGGTIEVTASNTLIGSGSLVGDACHVLTKTGTGMLVLTNAANNTSYAGGAIQVSAGILQVGGGGVGSTGTGLVSVASGAILAGSGTVAGSLSVASGGVLHMGDVTLVGNATTTTTGIGTLTVAGNVALAAGSTTYFSLDTPASSDFLNIGGNINLAGNVVVGGSFTPTFGQVFNLIDWVALGSDFTGFNVGVNGRTGADDNGFQFDLPDISAFTGMFWDVSNFTINGTIAIVPEPGRAMLVLFGLLALMMRRRRD